jgi:hypothetical protein
MFEQPTKYSCEQQVQQVARGLHTPKLVMFFIDDDNVLRRAKLVLNASQRREPVGSRRHQSAQSLLHTMVAVQGRFDVDVDLMPQNLERPDHRDAPQG